MPLTDIELRLNLVPVVVRVLQWHIIEKIYGTFDGT